MILTGTPAPACLQMPRACHIGLAAHTVEEAEMEFLLLLRGYSDWLSYYRSEKWLLCA
jgi:hypothetical protein